MQKTPEGPNNSEHRLNRGGYSLTLAYQDDKGDISDREKSKCKGMEKEMGITGPGKTVPACGLRLILNFLYFPVLHYL